MTVDVTETLSQTVHPAFQLVRQHHVEALDILVSEYKHKVTGAMHYHLATDHDENVFLVAFRTQPMDSKGEAHILEHTALCGSEKFPVRDPFFLMIRRSLNTFMNAFTAADWTAYPFATQNKKDFQNLLEVYMDAAFAANLNPLDFAQEGIRIELEDGQPVYKGVVFNEMKGAMSSPSDQLYHQLAHHLFPKTTYHYNSGGDPKDIPDLSYDELVTFYKSHYHPSNAIFMTFGDQSAYHLQEQFEKLALSKFTKGETIYSKEEQRLTAPIEVQETYAVDAEDLKDKTYHILSWLLPKTSDVKLRLGMRLVEGILLENSASPLRHYLETCGYAQSTGPIMGVDDSNYEMTFYCGVQGSNPEHAEAFRQGVLNILQDVASKPIDKDMVDAILHQIELHQREISGDGTPYGLTLILNGLGSAIHHNDPIHAWDVDTVIAEVKEELKDPMWLSNLIQVHLLDNPHRVQMTLVPDANKSALEAQEEKARLAKIGAALTDADKAEIIAQTEALKVRQETPDDLDLLPKVGLEDIPAELPIVQGQLREIICNGIDTPLNLYHAGTNGIYYQQVLIQIPDQIVKSPYFNLLSVLMGEVGAGEYDYLQLQQLQTAVSGGLGMGASLRSKTDDKGQISAWLTLTTKSLTDRFDAIGLLKLAFEQLRFDEKDRIIELLQQRKTRWASRLSGSGHSYAMQIASRQMSALAKRDYDNTGLGALNWLGDLVAKIENDEVAYDEFIEELKSIHRGLMLAPKQFLLVCEEHHSERLVEEVQIVWDKLSVDQAPVYLSKVEQDDSHADQAWLIQANVQFCASAYQAVEVSHPDAAPLMVLAGYLRNGFLHSAIREKGGAYGGGASYDGNACSFRFYSYRDPRLAETFQDFEASLDWLLNKEQHAYQLEEAILGLVSSMDKPGSPAGEAITACYALLHGRTPAFRKQLRERLLNVTIDDLKRVTQTYLVEQKPVKAVVAPVAKKELLEQLGFEIKKVN
ncbi:MULTISPECIES: insulinase family protein [Acinetobacter]|jgi:Zn-dependent M16 (insulinase) family peptidase|uniref:insulinase family protein n=1 Tax=Acinetobacter TaxID=469 RepID=UPI0002AE8BE5|nr:MULTISPECIES: insulinase family protein [Acinetobacter]ELW86833.1 peptidase M16C associated [Acinetobacter sp. WC-743]MBI0393857.1 insulinase family protein [Acinetobacter bereziniae]MBJ8423006.1 insulinase family protein [Acinetobacter bereziniae]MBJ8424507.1 insulinase family protein [Acinetobacter bereziniae]MBJ8452472.1 insulinase family protein [Acinetobacter bereziniae]